MISAIIRLSLITAGVLILSVIAVFSVRWLGFQQRFAPPPHPWYQMKEWHVVRAAPESVYCRDAASASADPSRIVIERVTRSEAGWIGTCSPLPIQEHLRQSPFKNWILEVIGAVETPVLDQLVTQVSSLDKERSIAIYAPAQQTARYLRKQAPQWLYAADSGSILRLHLFTSLWLEPALEFWPDFVLNTGVAKDGSELNEREVRELERRQKRYVAPQM